MNRVIFSLKERFYKDFVKAKIIAEGISLDNEIIYSKEQFSSMQLFIEELYTKPLLADSSIGIIDADEYEISSEMVKELCNSIPSHAYIIFLYEDNFPVRLSNDLKTKVYIRSYLSEDEVTQLLSNLLISLNKKLSATAIKFVKEIMPRNPQEVIDTLTKLAVTSPYLYIDENLIKGSFSEQDDSFKLAEKLFVAKGLEASRLVEQSDFQELLPAFLRYISTLIQFKLAENKPVGEKMKIIRAHPEVIYKLSDLVTHYTLNNLRARFIFYSAAGRLGKERFLIKFLTKTKWN